MVRELKSDYILRHYDWWKVVKELEKYEIVPKPIIWDLDTTDPKKIQEFKDAIDKIQWNL